MFTGIEAASDSSGSSLCASRYWRIAPATIATQMSFTVTLAAFFSALISSIVNCVASNTRLWPTGWSKRVLGLESWAGGNSSFSMRLAIEANSPRSRPVPLTVDTSRVPVRSSDLLIRRTSEGCRSPKRAGGSRDSSGAGGTGSRSCIAAMKLAPPPPSTSEWCILV